MDKLKALVTAETVEQDIAVLSDRVDMEFAGYCIDHNVMPRDELKRRIADKQILICEYDTIDKEILDCADELKLIVCCRGGVKTVIDLEEADRRGICVCNNGGRNARAVADMTMALILDLTRNISRTNLLIQNRVITTDVRTKPDEYRDVVWGLDNDSPFIRFRGRSVNHMTLGIVGLGNAGRRVARLADAFGMKILAYDPFADQSAAPDYVTFVSHDDLIATADVVTLHCVATPETKGMMNADRFAMMKDGAYFINTSRGELVDENALLDALNSGKLSGAALDVTAIEPIPSDYPLLSADNLIITPHIAGSAYDVQVEGTRMVVESVNEYLDGKRPSKMVNKGR